MNDYHIQAMTEVVFESLHNQKPNKKIIEQALQEYWQDKIASVWTVEDILTIDPTLTKDECTEVLYNIYENFNAELGITWDTLQLAIDEIIRRRHIRIWINKKEENMNDNKFVIESLIYSLIEKYDEMEEVIITHIMTWIELEARHIIDNNKNIKAFVMGMGSYTFRDNKDAGIYNSTKLKEFEKKLDDFNSRFKVCGNYLKINKNTKK